MHIAITRETSLSSCVWGKGQATSNTGQAGKEFESNKNELKLNNSAAK